ncbi:YhcH/YjgK/YiaL family protein [Salibacteraceae bacterium]|nr:YhcH/YjgK/YiaL family protein [Salibacteraceae bacterium]
MIKDKIENQHLYRGISERINQAFDFILNTDLKSAEVGRYAIDGDTVTAVVSEYETREMSDCKQEAHYKYIDVQYMIKGNERMGLTSLRDQKPYETNLDRDYSFYDEPIESIEFEEGSFMVLFPDDIHMPGIKYGESEGIKKVVVKVLI